jgi:hypothetical protein
MGQPSSTANSWASSLNKTLRKTDSNLVNHELGPGSFCEFLEIDWVRSGNVAFINESRGAAAIQQPVAHCVKLSGNLKTLRIRGWTGLIPVGASNWQLAVRGYLDWYPCARQI